MTYVVVYRLGYPDQPVACVRECVAAEKYEGDNRYTLAYYKPPSIR